MTKSGVAPGPPGHWITGHLGPIRRDVLGLMMRSQAEYGNVVRFRVGPLVTHLLCHPDHVAHVMIRRRANYDKASRSSECLGLICGESLLTSNGELWQRQRRMIQPMFHRLAVQGFVKEIERCAEDMVAEWEKAAREGREIDVCEEMMKVTFRIVGRCLFGEDLERDAHAVGGAMDVLIHHAYQRWRSVFNPPRSWPTPGNLRFRRALASVDAVISRMVEDQRRNPPANPNLLTMLAHGCGEGAEAAAEIRNEAITFLLAGHETTANALSWSLYRLATEPEWRERIRREAPAGGFPAEELGAQVSAQRVFEETCRLHPPIWAMERNAMEEDEISGFRIPRKSGVILSPYVLHRLPEFWERPEEFLPRRFERRDHEAYFPFGAGPRFCVGADFALAEARVLLPAVLRRFDFEPVPGQVVEADPAITLRIKGGYRIRLKSITRL